MSWVTVIVPVYNMERYVDRCIESVVQQTDGDFSLLLIVDGATDNSRTVSCMGRARCAHRGRAETE